MNVRKINVLLPALSLILVLLAFSTVAFAQSEVTGPNVQSATAGYGKVILKWKGVRNASAYNIYCGPVAGAEKLVHSAISGNTDTITDLKNGTTYYFYITATVNGTVSDPGFETSAIPIGTPPTITKHIVLNDGKPVTGVSAKATVEAATDGDAKNLTYTWSSTDPNIVTFFPNGTNSASTSMATFHKDGKYTITVTVTDPDGMTVTDTLSSK